MRASRSLNIRLLGELRLARGGVTLPLPPSRKTRALLGYLIATGQTHRRERLCDLFWDGPDDPRAELRWCLSKIRSLLSDDEARLVADRQRVCIELGNAAVDLRSVRSLLRDGVATASTDDLRRAVSLFGGEFLDGLDLPICYRYQEWCMAEREAVSRLKLSVLGALVERLQDNPEEALPHARALTVADPLSEAGHAAVVGLLLRVGRSKEAASHYERARRVFQTELGAVPSGELKEARKALESWAEASVAPQPSVRASDVPSAPAHPSPTGALAIGREAELALVARHIEQTVKRQAADVLLITGEAGIGKSHLLDRIGERMVSAGGCAWSARAFEPEAVRPYGIWFDILRAIVRERPREQLPANLGILLPEAGVVVDTGDRSRLFGAVVDLLRQVASERPILIAFDDIHWIDDASSSLLHYVARHIDTAPGMLIACTAREGEIEDNAATSSVLRSLARERRLQKMALNPLGPEDTIELVGLIDPGLDGARIFSESEGNPLFTLELARAHRRGEAEPGPTIEAVIGGQLARLTEQAQEILLWAAASGRAFAPDDIARAARLDDVELVVALGELERRGLVRPAGGVYDFTHDLVRQTAYRSISQPRRKLLHRHIARSLSEAGKRDATLAADLAYHAALAEDHETAARACVTAGERALRLFANVQAASFAERGLRHVERLAESSEKLETQVSLLKLLVLAAAGPGMRPLPPLIGTVAEVTSAAEKIGHHTVAATGHHLLSVLYQETGDVRGAEMSTLRAAAAGRAADDTTRANQLANTARCLLELETEVDRSRELIREGKAIVEPRGLELCELHWAQGLLYRWDGEAEFAVASLTRALALARKDEDRWREYKCLTWLAMIEQELGRYAEVQARCAELRTVASRLGEDEAPFVATLQALALLAAEEPSAPDMLAEALSRLRTVDDKSYLAYALNIAAQHYLRTGHSDQARLYASEALIAASAMRRENEAAISRAMLARAGAGSSPAAPDWSALSSRARSVLQEPARSPGRFQRGLPR